MTDIVDKQTEKYLAQLRKHFLEGGVAFDLPEPPNEEVRLRTASSLLQVAALATEMLRTGEIPPRPSRECVEDCLKAAESISVLYRKDDQHGH